MSGPIRAGWLIETVEIMRRCLSPHPIEYLILILCHLGVIHELLRKPKPELAMLDSANARM